MEDLERSRSMSLIPYQPEQSGQIVLRHDAAVVVYNERSKALSIRGMPRNIESLTPTSCPTCNRPYATSPNHGEPSPAMGSSNDADYMSPGYFRMLQHSVPASPSSSRPMTPSRQLRDESIIAGQDPIDPPAGAEFVSSAPSATASGGISASAFSPGYFERFFVEEGELGRGGKGVVLRVRHMLDRVSLGQFACKRVPVGDDHAWLEKVLVEVQLLQTLSHQNLVSYRHVWLQDYQVNTFGPSVPCAFILQQFCNGGDLQRYVLAGSSAKTPTTEQLKNRMRTRSRGDLDPPFNLHSHRRMPFEDIFSFFQDITSGLHHLHTHGYIHRDLKPQNCLLHHEGSKTRVLVSDFGEMQSETQIRTSSGATGTIAYCAPEVLRRSSSSGAYGAFTTKSDVFSLGMIVYFMCFGKLPYGSADQINDETEDLDILREEISAWVGMSEEWKTLPDRLFSALKRLLALDPDERPNTEEILQALLNNRSASPEVAHERRGSHGRASGPSVIDERRISSVDTPAPTPERRPSPRGRQNSLIRHVPKLMPSPLQHACLDEESKGPKQPSAVDRDLAETSNATQDLALVRSRHPSPINNTGFESLQAPDRSLSPSKRLALPAPPPAHSSIVSALTAPSRPRQAVLKLSFFLLKYLSMTKPCSPYASHNYITYPLLLLAILDFSTGSLPAWRIGFRASAITSIFSHDTLKSVVLIIVHFMVVWVAIRMDVLCENHIMGVYV